MSMARLKRRNNVTIQLNVIIAVSVENFQAGCKGVSGCVGLRAKHT